MQTGLRRACVSREATGHEDRPLLWKESLEAGARAPSCGLTPEHATRTVAAEGTGRCLGRAVVQSADLCLLLGAYQVLQRNKSHETFVFQKMQSVQGRRRRGRTGAVCRVRPPSLATAASHVRVAASQAGHLRSPLPGAYLPLAGKV